MMMTLNLLLLFLAVICFLLASVDAKLPLARPINFTGLGLFLWVLAAIIEKYKV